MNNANTNQATETPDMALLRASSAAVDAALAIGDTSLLNQALDDQGHALARLADDAEDAVFGEVWSEGEAAEALGLISGHARYSSTCGGWIIHDAGGIELGVHAGPNTIAGALAAIALCVEGSLELGTWDALSRTFAWTVCP